jgi:hypothetical protein
LRLPFLLRRILPCEKSPGSNTNAVYGFIKETTESEDQQTQAAQEAAGASP